MRVRDLGGHTHRIAALLAVDNPLDCYTPPRAKIEL
jgi:hypothetical protein